MTNLLSNELAFGWFGQTDTRIPVWMLRIPSQRFRRSAFHHQLWHDVAELVLKSSNPTVGQNDVRVKDFTCLWINTARSDRGTDVIVQPANEVVSNVFWIFIHVSTRLAVLLADLDRIGDTNVFERFVPVQNAFANKAAIANWRRVFDVENDRLLGRAQSKIRIPFFQMPAVDVTNFRFIFLVLSVVAVLSLKVSNSLVGFTWLEAVRAFDFADRKVQRLQHAVVHWHFVSDFDVLGESFCFLDRSQTRLWRNIRIEKVV